MNRVLSQSYSSVRVGLPRRERTATITRAAHVPEAVSHRFVSHPFLQRKERDGKTNSRVSATTEDLGPYFEHQHGPAFWEQQKVQALYEDAEACGCGAHMLLSSPFSSTFECHGAYKVTGPAVIVKKEVGGCVRMEAYLLEGAQVELPDPMGKGSTTITQAMLTGNRGGSRDEGGEGPACCVLVGQHMELSGSFDLDDTGASMHRLPGKGSTVVSVASLDDEATIILASDGELSYPVNIQPTPPGVPLVARC